MAISDREAAACVDVGTYPAQAAFQREIVGLADGASLRSEWRRSFGNWGGLRIEHRLVHLADHEAATRWFIDRLDELEACGVLPKISELSSTLLETQLEDDAPRVG